MFTTRRSVLALIPLIAFAAGCGSSNSSSTLPAPRNSLGASASIPGLSSTTGIETITGTITGAAALADKPTFQLTFTGPVATTATWVLPSNDTQIHQIATFKTMAGDFVANVTIPGNSNPNNQQPTSYNKKTCYMTFVNDVTFTADGAKSTGSFKGASGIGSAVITFAAYGPKLKSGACNTSQNAQPLTKGAISTFRASGTLTVKK
jgi:hypothetical protein